MQYCNYWPRTKCVTDFKMKIFSYGECISMSIDVFLLRWVNHIHIVCLKFIVPMIIRLSSLFSIVCNADCVSSDYTCRILLANRVDIFDLSDIDLDYVLAVCSVNTGYIKYDITYSFLISSFDTCLSLFCLHLF